VPYKIHAYELLTLHTSCLYQTTNPAHLVLGLDVMPKHRSLLKVIPGETSKYYDSSTEYVSDQTVSLSDQAHPSRKPQTPPKHQ
jgi:hypothetical protein